VAEGNSLDVPAFVSGFVGLFPDVHRDLKRITVSGDVVSIELSARLTPLAVALDANLRRALDVNKLAPIRRLRRDAGGDGRSRGGRSCAR